MVHDLNNVLTGVAGFGSLLRSELPDGEPAQRHLEMIDSLTAAGRDLTRQLLDFARHDDGATELVDLNDVVREVRGLTALATFDRIEVTLQLTEPLPQVRVERPLIVQALTNLVMNAADAMPGGGKIVLRTRAVEEPPAGEAGGPAVAIDVMDSGGGIPADVLPHVFKPFFTTKSRGNGTGLGLTSVQRIAERHGGGVHAKSTRGVGSTFALWVPIASR